MSGCLILSLLILPIAILLGAVSGEGSDFGHLCLDFSIFHEGQSARHIDFLHLASASCRGEPFFHAVSSFPVGFLLPIPLVVLHWLRRKQDCCIVCTLAHTDRSSAHTWAKLVPDFEV